ncbi:MAG: fused MFS/spermidine synthase [Alphaproteobacteria bacterium]|nr:fused MFS/spermidine synthase [Alphaproteobacteria bacterium]
MTVDKKSTDNTLVIFGLTIFISAACMFMVQPMAGWMLLPLVGGAPSGWIVAMAFFQTMLLAGYFLAHLLSRFSPVHHAMLYIGVLLAGLAFLPVKLNGGLLDNMPLPEPVAVFLLLTCALGLPFLALSATSSTVQRLFSGVQHKSSGDPYFLYAASNFGSFIGLWAYPFLVEPYFRLSVQSHMWLGAYVLLIALGCMCLWLAKRQGVAALEKPAAPVTGKAAKTEKRMMWLILSFFPSTLLVGVTGFITTDVISVPLIWILPLSLYLLTFVAAFSQKRIFKLQVLEALMPFVVVGTIMLMIFQVSNIIHVTLATIPLYLFSFTFVALYCHTRLADLRPVEDNRRLTEFYLFLSIGGALGGVVNAFVLPVILNRMIEFPLMMIASTLVLPTIGLKKTSSKIMLGLLALSFLLVHVQPMVLPVGHLQDLRVALFLAMIGCMILPDRKMMLGALVVFMISEFAIAPNALLHITRNFYGVTRVLENHVKRDGKPIVTRTMRHGTTEHGLQILTDEDRTKPTIFFSEAGPLGEVFWAYRPKRVLVVGLGTGTIACHTAPDREFTFIEIDKEVVDVAQEYFTFLSECKSKEPPRLIVGDGRREIEKMEDEVFDLIILDAFSSDVIPTHLLTVEAFASYLEKLSPQGIVASHVSNRYFRLQPALAAVGAEHNLRVIQKMAAEVRDPLGASGHWVLLAQPGVSTEALDKNGWFEARQLDSVKPWTDDYTNLLATLRYFIDAKR